MEVYLIREHLAHRSVGIHGYSNRGFLMGLLRIQLCIGSRFRLFIGVAYGVHFLGTLDSRYQNLRLIIDFTNWARRLIFTDEQESYGMVRMMYYAT